MKLLFDPIYSNYPRKCSSAAKFKKLSLRMLEEREDVFIYWRLPAWCETADHEWLPNSPRIRYIPCASFQHDRVREYQVFPFELADQLSFSGDFWDFDVVLTMRTSQVPNIRVCMNSSRHVRAEWQKAVFVMEEMAVTSWRKSVPQSSPRAQDIMTYAGYLAADRTYITANHVRDGILRGSREFFAPSLVRTLPEKILLVNPSILDKWEAKEPQFRHRPGQTVFRPFYVGRLSNPGQLEVAFDALDKQWIMNGDAVAPGISSQSATCKTDVPEALELQYNDRDAFWKCLRETAHVVVNNAIDAEFSLATIEPICLGVPVTVPRNEWAVSLFGDEFPFFFQGQAELYGWLSAFRNNYDQYYNKFLAWRDGIFRHRMTEGLYGTNLYDACAADLLAFDAGKTATVKAKWAKREENELFRALVAQVKDKTEIVIMDELKVLCTVKDWPTMHAKIRDLEAWRRDTAMPFWSAWNDYRLLLASFHGWTDASTTVGHMRRVG